MNNSNIPDKIYNIFNSQTIEEAISKVDNEVKKADMKKGLEMENTLKPLFETKFGFLNKTHHYHSFEKCVYIKNEYIKNYNDLPFLPFQYDESSKHDDEH